MGMDVGRKQGGLNCTINVTPMADVMLVLLIIIMLIAPLLQKGIDVTLQRRATRPTSLKTIRRPSWG